VVTTGGGLYRYSLGDRVEVVDRIGACPILRFVGRESVISDWVGEKLLDAHVAAVLQKVFRQLDVKPSFAMLAFDPEPGPAYSLFLESEASAERGPEIAAAVDAGLRSNFQYDYARLLGQLGAVRVVPVLHAFASFADYAARTGQKFGSIKVPALEPRQIWRKILATECPQ
jgi:hypothetical protein